ncbi:MAG: hypothetical protein JSV34_01520 [Candidatus Omnitrophota bacterium]|nr:MAG: hypothetical protein JSV34_01520 [Candidatus Omnitrophota bacterium]
MQIYKVAKVVLPIALDKDFDYSIPSDLEVRKGDRVLVNFGGSRRVAIVVDLKKESVIKHLKPLIEVLDSCLTCENIEFARKLSKLYPYAMGEFLFMMMPPSLKRVSRSLLKQPAYETSRQISRRVSNIFIKRDSFPQRYSIWKEKVKEKLKQGSVLICFPQLTYLKEAKKIIDKDFAGGVRLVYSQQSQKELFINWQQTRNNALILGTRVALFYYPGDLNLIVVEEENSPYYFQEEKPFYHLLDVVGLLSKMKEIDVILSADYPALSTYKLIEEKKTSLNSLKLKEGRPQIKVVDISGVRQRVITPIFQELLRKNIRDGRRIVVIWNRKGFGSYLSCLGCGHILKCERCSGLLQVSLKEDNAGLCPYCAKKTVVPKICNKCNSGYIKTFGLGIERIEVILKRIFPEVKIGKWQEGAADAQVILATSKILSSLYCGYNFDVGFLLDADSFFSRPDYEATFNAFIYVKQLSLFLKEALYVFTRNANHYLFENLCGNWQDFYGYELGLRRELRLPPFGNIIKIILRDKNENKLLKKSQALYNRLKNKKLEVYGPLAEVPFKLRGNFRYSLIIKGKKGYYLRKLLKEEIKNLRRTHVKLAVIIR